MKHREERRKEERKKEGKPAGKKYRLLGKKMSGEKRNAKQTGGKSIKRRRRGRKRR